MEIQASDSKKLFKVFDASKHKRTRKKREGLDDTNSVATDDSNSGCQANLGRITSGKTSLQDMPTAGTADGHPNGDSVARDRNSSTSVQRDGQRSPRRHRRPTRDGLSLALKAELVSTPRSISPQPDCDAGAEPPTQDHDSYIYAFLEEAIKRDKKKHRYGRRHEEHRSSRDREASDSRDHRHRHRRRRDDVPSRERDKHRKEESPSPAINQTVLLETFAKLCAQMKENYTNNSPVQRTQSHKSLQCEVASRRDLYNADRRPERPPPQDFSHDNDTPRVRSQENCHQIRSREKIESRLEKCSCYDKGPIYESKKDYDKEFKYAPKIDYYKEPKYSSKIDVNRSRAVVCSRVHEDERYRNYPPNKVATRTFIDQYRDRPHDSREYRDIERRTYDDRRRYIEQKTSRSFEVHRDGYEEERCRRTARSDTKDKRYDDKYYEKPVVETHERHFPSKERRARRLSDRFERNSIASREEEFRDRDRYSERERDSGLSVADGETSTISGRTGKSNYLNVVKQEIAEQREAMDKMMKLWKELMRCFKGISQTQDKDKTLNETACENVRESAAAQLRLWRECMRRYETVARDVGDTDARLMEEINKQRSEMSEMATMWQECLQRYRDMSNDFNTLKQQLATAESPTRQPAPTQPIVCAEGEGNMPSLQYRLPPASYPQLPPPSAGGAGAYSGGSPLRGRASVPPAWWWSGERPPPRRRSSRRSSPDSRHSREGRATDRDRRHRTKEARDVSRYKEKASKPSAARSEHRRRKR